MRAPWGSTVETFGGLPVVPRFGSRAYDWLVGGRVAQRIANTATVGVSYVQQREDGEIANKELGADLAAAPAPLARPRRLRRVRRHEPGPRRGTRIRGRALGRLAARALRVAALARPAAARDVALLRARRLSFADARDDPAMARRPAARLARERRRSGCREGSRAGTVGCAPRSGSTTMEMALWASRRAAWTFRARNGPVCAPSQRCLSASGFRYSSEIEVVVPDVPDGRGVAWPWGLSALSWRSRDGWELASALEASSTPQQRYEVDALLRLSRAFDSTSPVAAAGIAMRTGLSLVMVLSIALAACAGVLGLRQRAPISPVRTPCARPQRDQLRRMPRRRVVRRGDGAAAFPHRRRLPAVPSEAARRSAVHGMPRGIVRASGGGARASAASLRAPAAHARRQGRLRALPLGGDRGAPGGDLAEDGDVLRMPRAPRSVDTPRLRRLPRRSARRGIASRRPPRSRRGLRPRARGPCRKRARPLRELPHRAPVRGVPRRGDGPVAAVEAGPRGRHGPLGAPPRRLRGSPSRRGARQSGALHHVPHRELVHRLPHAREGRRDDGPESAPARLGQRRDTASRRASIPCLARVAMGARASSCALAVIAWAARAATPTVRASPATRTSTVTCRAVSATESVDDGGCATPCLEPRRGGRDPGRRRRGARDPLASQPARSATPAGSLGMGPIPHEPRPRNSCGPGKSGVSRLPRRRARRVQEPRHGRLHEVPRQGVGQSASRWAGTCRDLLFDVPPVRARSARPDVHRLPREGGGRPARRRAARHGRMHEVPPTSRRPVHRPRRLHELPRRTCDRARPARRLEGVFGLSRRAPAGDRRNDGVLVVPCAARGAASGGSRLLHRLPSTPRLLGGRRAGVHPLPRREDDAGRGRGAGPQICTSCHTPHDPTRAAVACVRCHQDIQVEHGAQGACVTCHEPHGADPTIVAVSCTSCHAKVAVFDTAAHAGGITCEGCHKPHQFAGLDPKALCENCHARETTLVAANKGHADCTSCHGAQVAHTPAPPAACGTCHAAEAKSAPAGHQRCVGCHEPHAGQPVANCATCHANKTAGPHATIPGGCETCHRPHGPSGVAAPPGCKTCHAPSALPALHAAAGHSECASCHVSSHEPPRADRGTCTGSCHLDKRDHQPGAQVCTGCHVFRR